MAKPTQPNEPEDAAYQEECDSGQKSTLGQLAEARNEKAADGSNDVTRRTLTHTSTEHSSSAESCCHWNRRHPRSGGSNFRQRWQM